MAPRLFNLLTAQIIRRDLRPDALRAEAVEHMRGTRMAELRAEFEKAIQARDREEEPAPPAEELVSARSRAEVAKLSAETQREVLRLAEDRHSAAMQAEPQGWRRLLERLKGGLHGFAAERADAAASLKTAQEYRRARDYIAQGAATTLERQERVEEKRQAKLEASRRDVRVAAALRMEHARVAAKLLRETGDLAFLSLPALFDRAERERRRQVELRLSGEHADTAEPTIMTSRP